MTWATPYIKKLQAGEVVQFRPRGGSMAPRIHSGELCTIAPILDYGSLIPGAAVLCRVNGHQYLHLIKAVQGNRFQIGNNKGKINGWISAHNIYGVLTRVEP